MNIISGCGVRPSDIAALPFADFWLDSAVGSGQIQDQTTGEWLIHLHDWEAFCQLFIETGMHRNIPEPPEVLWFDRDDDEPERSYFGVEISPDKMIRESDVTSLPFYYFWCESDEAGTSKTDPKTGERCIQLSDWKTFCRRFIHTR